MTEMNNIQIPKSIIDSLFAKNLESTLDDENELFPFLSIIINGTTKTISSSQDQDKIRETLTQYIQEKYIAFWLSWAPEWSEGEVVIEDETEKAIERFEELKNILQHPNNKLERALGTRSQTLARRI